MAGLVERFHYGRISMNLKTTAIVNPISGNIKRVRGLKASLREYDPGTEIMVTEGPGDAAELARRAVEKGSSLIISVSGDGTINEVINGMAGSEAALGIIPAGVSNVLALELGIPRDWEEALRVIQEGRRRLIDLGRVNGRYFSLMVGVGFDAQSVKLANPAAKRYLKRYAYHLAGFRTICFYQPRPFRIKFDGLDQISAYAAIISNAHYYGGTHQVSPEARLDDGYLHLCVCKKGRRRDYLRYFYGVLKGRLSGYPDVIEVKARTAEIQDSAHPVHADGDFIGYTPLKISIEPHCLPVIVPGSKSPDSD